MTSEKSSTEYSRDNVVSSEEESLMGSGIKHQSKRLWFFSYSHILGLYISNFLLLLLVAVLSISFDSRRRTDPTLGIYCMKSRKHAITGLD